MNSRSRVTSSYHHRPHQLGKDGEDEAARYLLSCSYEIVERNWRGSCGELDIIALAQGNEDGTGTGTGAGSGKELLFIEVKTRSSLRFGDPLDAITPEKYRRIYLLAREWLALNYPRATFRMHIRIDVIVLVKNGTGFEIVHHKGLLA